MAPGSTVTEAGAVRSALLSVTVTVVPDAGAALLRVIVQVEAAPDPRAVGEQASEDTVTDVTRLMLAVCEVLPSAAVMVAL